MGICCTNRAQLANVQRFNVRRRESVENNKAIISSASFTTKTRRTSIYIYNNEDIYKNYIFEKQIGRGYFGTVNIVIPKTDSNKRYACKSINIISIKNSNCIKRNRNIKFSRSSKYSKIL